MGRPDEAIEILRGLVRLPDNDDAFRRLRNKALGMLLECFLQPTVKNYAEATRYARQWMAGVRSGDPAEPESLRVHYLAGRGRPGVRSRAAHGRHQAG